METTTNITDLATDLAEMDALAGWLEDAGLPADEAGVEHFRMEIATCLEELTTRALPGDLDEALGVLMGIGWDEAVADALEQGPEAVLEDALAGHVKAGGLPVAPAARARLLARWQAAVDAAAEAAVE